MIGAMVLGDGNLGLAVLPSPQTSLSPVDKNLRKRTLQVNMPPDRKAPSMLTRRPVIRAHVLPLIALHVRPDQLDLVSNNAKTLAEAAYEPGSHVWGLWVADTLVGLMAMINPAQDTADDYPLIDPRDGTPAAYLWRLMVGADFQGRGYGAAALQMAFAQTRDWGFSRLFAHVSHAPHSNLPFYQHHGFANTGVVQDGELVIAIDLHPTGPT
jgi:diamine N-acetyltransferase